MKIKVTQDNIDAGKRCTSNFCPVALAFHDAGFPLAVVGPQDVCLDKGDTATLRLLPAEAQNFVGHFDRGDEVEPFEFEVRGLTEGV